MIEGTETLTKLNTMFEMNYVKIPTCQFPLEIKFSSSEPKILMTTMIPQPMIKITTLRAISNNFQTSQRILVFVDLYLMISFRDSSFRVIWSSFPRSTREFSVSPFPFVQKSQTLKKNLENLISSVSNNFYLQCKMSNDTHFESAKNTPEEIKIM